MKRPKSRTATAEFKTFAALIAMHQYNTNMLLQWAISSEQRINIIHFLHNFLPVRFLMRSLTLVMLLQKHRYAILGNARICCNADSYFQEQATERHNRKGQLSTNTFLKLSLCYKYKQFKKCAYLRKNKSQFTFHNRPLDHSTTLGKCVCDFLKSYLYVCFLIRITFLFWAKV